MVKFYDCVVLFNPKNRAPRLFPRLDNINNCTSSFIFKLICHEILATIKKNPNCAISPHVILEATHNDVGENQ